LEHSSRIIFPARAKNAYQMSKHTILGDFQDSNNNNNNNTIIQVQEERLTQSALETSKWCQGSQCGLWSLCPEGTISHHQPLATAEGQFGSLTDVQPPQRNTMHSPKNWQYKKQKINDKKTV
jgi:hypothetical protein